MSKGNLFVVSGPSGAGKSTICRLVRKILNINLATSATTRKPRVGEIDGRDYYFLTIEEFERKLKNDEFLEYAKVHENYYGTLKSEVENRLAKGENVILEIDVQGGLQVKAKYPNANMIFFKTPTKEELEQRLRGRKTDSEETIQLRLKNSLKELEYEKEYDTTIINYTVEKSCEELINIIRSKEEEK
ncbi:guanylate kinase [Fusobacterium perfoetens]|uniref:guanylate kinase n=1 Tax=Fusobacterium perfoetens TaxID=852 RepID=UPI0004827B24|nr:guanylate kinase [Fusobacterium perfoetens]MCI6152977.1 guanylate kinase [Fusobacterium perfoetens]MDY3237374.1 guanylate kinase [Fusobacterium perfoetens]